MKKLYNKLNITEDRISMEAHPDIYKLKIIVFIVMVLFCIAMSFLLIKTQDTPFKYLCIPVFLIFCFIYVFAQLEIGHGYNPLILTADKFSISYYNEETTTIPTAYVTNVVDKSFYYDFNGNGPFNKGWHHTIQIYYKDSLMNEQILSVDHIYIDHEQFLLLFNFLKSLLES